MQYVVGDARLSLQETKNDKLDLLIIDAFSSDSIPTHLLTKEALTMYWNKLRANGILAINISNRYFNFTNVLGPLASSIGAQAYLRDVENMSDKESDKTGVTPSSWVVIAKDNAILAHLAKDSRWKYLIPGNFRLWTDDYSNIFTLLH